MLDELQAAISSVAAPINNKADRRLSILIPVSAA
jgi:hypothetical protein